MPGVVQWSDLANLTFPFHVYTDCACFSTLYSHMSPGMHLHFIMYIIDGKPPLNSLFIL